MTLSPEIKFVVGRPSTIIEPVSPPQLEKAPVIGTIESKYNPSDEDDPGRGLMGLGVFGTEIEDAMSSAANQGWRFDNQDSTFKAELLRLDSPGVMPEKWDLYPIRVSQLVDGQATHQVIAWSPIANLIESFPADVDSTQDPQSIIENFRSFQFNYGILASKYKDANYGQPAYFLDQEVYGLEFSPDDQPLALDLYHQKLEISRQVTGLWLSLSRSGRLDEIDPIMEDIAGQPPVGTTLFELQDYVSSEAYTEDQTILNLWKSKVITDHLILIYQSDHLSEIEEIVTKVGDNLVADPDIRQAVLSPLVAKIIQADPDFERQAYGLMDVIDRVRGETNNRE